MTNLKVLFDKIKHLSKSLDPNIEYVVYPTETQMYSERKTFTADLRNIEQPAIHFKSPGKSREQSV